MKDMRLMVIEWEDSRQPTGQWEYMDNIDFPKICRCVSVGYLIKDEKYSKVLAPNFADIENKNNMQVSGMITIPSACIKSVKLLKVD